MDKYEYNLKLDQIKTLLSEGNYKDAEELADTINWNKIKNVNALVKLGEVYEKAGRYEESRDILLNAYDRSPIGRNIIYRLAEVAIKMQDFDGATEYYEEFVGIAPHDTQRYIIKYELMKAKEAPLEELIPVLEEFKEQEFTEEWAYELAYLYHKAEEAEKCVEICDELILWFGDGAYVERALELKMLYQPLTKVQEEKYRGFRRSKEGKTEIGATEMERAGEYVHDSVVIPQVTLNPERFNTVNLQEEIVKGMQQILGATEKETVEGTMDNIKKIVEEIPYLQIPKEEIIENGIHIETDEEIDGSLKMNFQELLGEESDGQMRLVMREKAMIDRQITGQMSIAEVLDEWEKTKRAAEIALQEAEQRKLESAKARALIEAEDIMVRLNDVIPKIEAGVTPKVLPAEEFAETAAESQESEILKESLSQGLPDISAWDFGTEAKIEPILSLTDEQKAIFSYFVPVHDMEEQLCKALTGITARLKAKESASAGNLAIQGNQGCGKTVLATSIIKVLQKEGVFENGKVGKIDAKALNKKDVQQLLRKVSGGCLIIESAGELERAAAVTLSLLLEQDRSGILVILEDSAMGIKRAMALDEGFAAKFTEMITVPIFTNDELVSFAKSYANELGYKIDAVAILALHNRISSIEKLDQTTRLEEVKEIIDEAIDKEAKSGLRKAFNILTAKRYTDDEKIVLTEKDFE
uniref:tetratricopeptide repeat protein n=1 Tax=Agathobacter sp. TaxID=2021311 RepID=UPI0040572420